MVTDDSGLYTFELLDSSLRYGPVTCGRFLRTSVRGLSFTSSVQAQVSTLKTLSDLTFIELQAVVIFLFYLTTYKTVIFIACHYLFLIDDDYVVGST